MHFASPLAFHYIVLVPLYLGFILIFRSLRFPDNKNLNKDQIHHLLHPE